MLPVLAPPLKRRSAADAPPGGVSTAVIWLAPYAVFMPAMAAVGLVLLIAPKRRASWELYAKGLAALLETSLKQAVAYRAAAASQRTGQGRTRARTRPSGSTRPSGKPGAVCTTRRTRQKR